jgi:hypothetical protein
VASWWPWLAVAGVGALHGLNPASGWLAAAAWGVRSGDRARARWALVPIAVGHTASVLLVATAVLLGVAMDRTALQAIAAGLVAAVAILHLFDRARRRMRTPAGHAALALWSFMMATAHGAGVMLVPALIPLCAAGGATGHLAASGPLALALAAVGVHTAAMLAVTGAVATGVCRGVDAGAVVARRLLRRTPCPAAERCPVHGGSTTKNETLR